jgi:hypothetical protein
LRARAQEARGRRTSSVQNKIFHVFSAKGPTAYIPANRLLRIVADSESSIVTIFFEGGVAVVTDTLEGTAVDVAERLLEDLASSPENWVYLSSKVSNVTGVHF